MIHVARCAPPTCLAPPFATALDGAVVVDAAYSPTPLLPYTPTPLHPYIKLNVTDNERITETLHCLRNPAEAQRSPRPSST